MSRGTGRWALGTGSNAATDVGRIGDGFSSRRDVACFSPVLAVNGQLSTVNPFLIRASTESPHG